MPRLPHSAEDFVFCRFRLPLFDLLCLLAFPFEPRVLLEKSFDCVKKFFWGASQSQPVWLVEGDCHEFRCSFGKTRRLFEEKATVSNILVGKLQRVAVPMHHTKHVTQEDIFFRSTPISESSASEFHSSVSLRESFPSSPRIAAELEFIAKAPLPLLSNAFSTDELSNLISKFTGDFIGETSKLNS